MKLSDRLIDYVDPYKTPFADDVRTAADRLVKYETALRVILAGELDSMEHVLMVCRTALDGSDDNGA